MVRIHWAIVVLGVIGTVTITWYLRTKDMNFLKPKGNVASQKSETVSFAKDASAVQPEIKKNPETAIALPGEAKEPEKVPEVAPIEEEDLGDLEAAPGLDAYRDFARNNPGDRLFALSSTLRSRGHFQRALLAIERIVDTSEPDPELLTEASLGISALSKTLPRWNVDPKAEITLVLNLSMAHPAPEALKQSLVSLALLIRQSSGDQLEVIPKIQSKDNSEAPEDGPVALWLSSEGEEPTASPVITARLSHDSDRFFSDLSGVLFKAVRSGLEKAGFPPVIALDLEAPKLLETQITRLMWLEFGRSLVPAVEEIEENVEEVEPFTPEN
jgi:hypothetical protein